MSHRIDTPKASLRWYIVLPGMIVGALAAGPIWQVIS